MNLDFHYLHLALSLFPHARGHMEGPSNYVPPCECRNYALDSSPDKTQYRIRCLECQTGLVLPPGIDWPSIWKRYFEAKHDKTPVEKGVVGVDSKSSNPLWS